MRLVLLMIMLITLTSSCGATLEELQEVEVFKKRCVTLGKYLGAKNIRHRMSNYGFNHKNEIVCLFSGKEHKIYFINKKTMDSIIGTLLMLNRQEKLNENVNDFLNIN